MSSALPPTSYHTHYCAARAYAVRTPTPVESCGLWIVATTSSYYKYTRRSAFAIRQYVISSRARSGHSCTGDSIDAPTTPTPSPSRPNIQRRVQAGRGMPPSRLPLAGALLLALVLAVSGEGGDAHAPRLRGSVACLDCAAGHDLSGVVVAVKCAGVDGLHAAQTDSRGAFDVAMPGAAASTPCAARVLGSATEQLCAPGGFAAARVVPGGAPGLSLSSSSYALGSRLAVFTRCGPASSGGSAVAATMDAPDRQQRQGDAPRPRVPEPSPMPPPPPPMQMPVVRAAPRAGAGGNGSPPPFGAGGGLPLIIFFPFIPIIGIP